VSTEDQGEAPRTEKPEPDEDQGEAPRTEKPEPNEEHREKAAEMAKVYEEDRGTAVLPGTGGTVTGTAINEWLDDEGNLKDADQSDADQSEDDQSEDDQSDADQTQ
jgi:hypothetical protein